MFRTINVKDHMAIDRRISRYKWASKMKTQVCSQRLFFDNIAQLKYTATETCVRFA